VALAEKQGIQGAEVVFIVLYYIYLINKD